MKSRTASWALGAALVLATPSFAGTGNEAPPAPDNTEKNQEAGMTADDQGMSASDTELTRKIRAAIMKADALSTYAKNVKIITKAGEVTLKGPVRSEDEKGAVDKIAVEIAGNGHVTNQLTVAPPQ